MSPGSNILDLENGINSSADLTLTPETQNQVQTPGNQIIYFIDFSLTHELWTNITYILEAFSTPIADNKTARSTVDIMRLVDHTASIIDSVSNKLQSTQIVHDPQNVTAMMNRTVSMMENIAEHGDINAEQIGSEEIAQIDVAESQKEKTPPAESGRNRTFFNY